MRIKLLTYFLITVFIGCENKSELTAPPKLDSGVADFSNFVVLGGSLAAGYQNGALYKTAQKYSIGKLIAEQMDVKFLQPLFMDPGIGGRIEVISLNPIVTTTRDIYSESITNFDLSKSLNNLAIPGAYLRDILFAKNSRTAIDNNNVIFDLILRNQDKTVFDQLDSSNSTFAILWAGEYDVLDYAMSGGTLPHTSVQIFSNYYDVICKKLVAYEVDVVLANIPRINSTPFFNTMAPFASRKITEMHEKYPLIKGLIYQVSAAKGTEIANSESLLSNNIKVTLQGLDAINLIGDTLGLYYFLNSIPIPPEINISQPFGLSSENPFPNEFVLDLSEQFIVESIISNFNSIIATAAINYDLPLVDLHDVYDHIVNNKYNTYGLTFTAEYILGGLFSSDGIFPTSQGYAVISNLFIETINKEFKASIPKINVASVPGSIELSKK